MDFLDMRNELGSILLSDEPGDDNLGIALCTYFSDHPECPEDDEENDSGWGEWAERRADETLDKIVAVCERHIESERTPRLAAEARVAMVKDLWASLRDDDAGFIVVRYTEADKLDAALSSTPAPLAVVKRHADYDQSLSPYAGDLHSKMHVQVYYDGKPGDVIVVVLPTKGE